MTNFETFYGKTLREICKERGLNYTTVTQRRANNPGLPLEDYLYPPREKRGGNSKADLFTEDGESVYQKHKDDKSLYAKICYQMVKKHLSYSEAIQAIKEKYVNVYIYKESFVK